MSRVRRRVLVLGSTLALVLAVTVLLSANWLTGLYFYPKQGCDPPPAEAAPCEVVKIPAVDGTLLEGWLFPAHVEPGGRPRAVVVHAHGNGWNLEKQWRFARELAQRGFDVVAFDYRGFGNSPGRATRRSAIEDIESVVAWAHVRARSEGVPVALFGQSMGAALSIDVGARETDLAAVVADAPFDSWPGVAASDLVEAGWARTIVSGTLTLLLRTSGSEPRDLVGRVHAPLLIITGTADHVCPPDMARGLAKISKCRLLEIDGAEHVGRRTPEQGKLTEDTVVAFLDGAIAKGER